MNTGARDGRDDTTTALLDAAFLELREVGQADFSMESVGRRAFYSVGTVYSRWPDREACIAEVTDDIVLARLESTLNACNSLEDVVRAVLTNPDGIFTVVGECVLAGDSLPPVAEPARRVMQTLKMRLRAWMGPGMAWYLSTLAVGGALLDLMDVPPPPADAAPVWVDACNAEVDPRAVGGPLPSVGPVSIPVVPEPTRNDPVAASLIEAARVVLAERGASGAGTREIASAAGVTTGALYRRYDGKARLLADVLVAELQPDRYAWTWDLIGAFASEDPYSAAADVLAERITSTSADLAGQRVLMQIGVAARNQPALRSQVNQRIRVALDARQEMAQHLGTAGILRDDVDPATTSWAFQALPIGIRAMLPLLDGPDADDVRSAMRAMLVAVSAPATRSTIDVT